MSEQQPKRTPLEIAGMVAYTLVTFVLGAIITLGVPTLAVWRAWHERLTAQGVFWGLVAALWLGLLLNAVIRNRETRGWIAFLLVGWVFLIPQALRAILGPADS